MSVLMSMIVYPATQASLLFFFNDTATTEIYTLSLHDALPICTRLLEILKAEMGFPDHPLGARVQDRKGQFPRNRLQKLGDRKSTRLNSSHSQISYAVFCLKKKKGELTTGIPIDGKARRHQTPR